MTRPRPRKGYASGGLIEKPAEGDWTDNVMGRRRKPNETARDSIDRKPPGSDKPRVFTPDLYQGKDKYPSPTKDDKPFQASRGGKITRVAGKPVGKEDGLIAVQKGEFVVRKAAVQKHGPAKMAAVNKGTARITIPKGGKRK